MSPTLGEQGSGDLVHSAASSRQQPRPPRFRSQMVRDAICSYLFPAKYSRPFFSASICSCLALKFLSDPSITSTVAIHETTKPAKNNTNITILLMSGEV